VCLNTICLVLLPNKYLFVSILLNFGPAKILIKKIEKVKIKTKLVSNF